MPTTVNLSNGAAVEPWEIIASDGIIYSGNVQVATLLTENSMTEQSPNVIGQNYQNEAQNLRTLHANRRFKK